MSCDQLLNQMRTKAQQVEKLVKNARGIERMLDDTDTEQCVIVMWEKLSQIEQAIAHARNLAKLAHEKAIRCQLEQTQAYVAQLSELRDQASASATEGAEMVQSAMSSMQRSNMYAEQLRSIVEEIQAAHGTVQSLDSQQQELCNRALREISAAREKAQAAVASAAAATQSLTSAAPPASAGPVVPTKPPRAGKPRIDIPDPSTELPSALPPEKPLRTQINPAFSDASPASPGMYADMWSSSWPLCLLPHQRVRLIALVCCARVCCVVDGRTGALPTDGAGACRPG